MSGETPARDSFDCLKRKCPGANIPQGHAALPPASALAANVCSHHERFNYEDESSSVETLLTVPLDFIFCESPRTPSTGTAGPLAAARGMGGTQPPPSALSYRRRKTLLSRSEAAVLLRVNQLAVEMDVLQSVASKALDRTRLCRDIRGRIERCGRSARRRIGSAYLRPLLPLLQVHGADVPRWAVAHVASETGRVLSELEGCAAALRQFAEQNWSVAEQLCDAFGYDENTLSTTGTGLGREKRAVAEVEEAVSSRIEGLVAMATQEHDHSEGGIEDDCFDAFDIGTDKETGEFLPMNKLCRQLLCGAGCDSIANVNDTTEKSIKKKASTITGQHNNDSIRNGVSSAFRELKSDGYDQELMSKAVSNNELQDKEETKTEEIPERERAAITLWALMNPSSSISLRQK
uniref:Uncharacterized protein n=1 Tax=Odontella aurita TaxID=265563 RepID=A0A7S4JYA6_9STRA|mmetsp:Transcript_56376/g.168748  ORF Transcript_56376/g.168748 Transcript_56376/m.168748 type:complete len:406 (+) Transcript_56376:148-1365(+)